MKLAAFFCCAVKKFYFPHILGGAVLSEMTGQHPHYVMSQIPTEGHTHTAPCPSLTQVRGMTAAPGELLVSGCPALPAQGHTSLGFARTAFHGHASFRELPLA